VAHQNVNFSDKLLTMYKSARDRSALRLV